MILIEIVRSILEVILGIAIFGLVAVGVSFLILIAINIVELATGKLWREPVLCRHSS